jgi:alpha-methylacyl-CoA racemase
MVSYEPLQGVRVVSLAVNVPGPVAAARLAELGAEVCKIEPPAGDPLQAYCSEWYEGLHRQVEVRRLDLKDSSGRAELDAMLLETDVFLTSNRPAALARLGLAPAELGSRFPRLCQVAIVGESGNAGDRPGHDLTYVAEAGLLNGPEMPRTLLADLGGAERAVSASLALLLSRGRTGTGGVLEVSLATTAQSFASPYVHGLTAPAGRLGGNFPEYSLYQSADGWIALAALEPHFQQRVCEALGIAALDRSVLERMFALRPTGHWLRLSEELGIPLAGAG